MVYIIDTNVLIIANDYDHESGIECVENCIEFLIKARNNIIAVDDMDRVFEEYRRYVSPSGKPDLGDEFMGWLWQNRTNTNVCKQVTINDIDGNLNVLFEGIPIDGSFDTFDKSDQKFIAIALNIDDPAKIVNASDTDWKKHEKQIKAIGIEVIELCPDYIASKIK